MTQISSDHIEWAVVARLRSLLEEPPHVNYNVTQAYSLFTAILCWVVQRIRIRTNEIDSADDRIAHKLFEDFARSAITDDPWFVAPTRRIQKLGHATVVVPAPVGFEEHTAERFLVNLRDATAHGDARNVTPFNAPVGSGELLVGFTFICAEFRDRRRTKIWDGCITLLESDMRRIGIALAKKYCNTLRRSESHRHDSHFGSDAASIKERAA